MPADPYIGEIFAAGFNFPPVGYASCNGQLLLITQNTALFALIGTTYGGDGVRTFGLPDLRGRVPIGFGQGPGLTNYDLGAVLGVESVTLTQGQMPSHTHQLTGKAGNGDSTGPGGRVSAKSSQADKIYGTPDGTATMAGQAIGPAGGNQPHENRQPLLALNFYIALQGIFPSRT